MADYTREQIYEAMRRADAAGDGDAVKKLAAALKAGASKPEILDIARQNNLTVDEPALDANLASRDAGGPVNQFVPPKQATLADGVQNAVVGSVVEPFAGTYDFMQEVGKAPTYAMNALTRFAGKGANALGMETIGNALISSSDEYDRRLAEMPTAMGAIRAASPVPQGMENARLAANLIGGVAMPFGPKAAPKVTMPKPNALSEAQQVVQAGKEAGVRVMTSDVRPPRSFVGKSARAIGERIPFAGTGGPRVAQNEERIKAVKDLARDFGIDGSQEVLDDVADDLAKTRGGKIAALAGRKNKIIQDLSGGADGVPRDIAERGFRHESGFWVFDTPGGQVAWLPEEGIVNGASRHRREVTPEIMREVLGLPAQSASSQGGAVAAPNTIAAIDQQIARLSGINADAFAPVIAKLTNFKDQLGKGLTLEQVEGNRKLLGDLFADPSLAAIKGDGQKALNAIYAPLRDDMGAFIKARGGDDAFNAWKRSNDELAAMAGELDSSAFRSVLQNTETTPEKVASLLFSKKPSDVRRLYANLSPAGQEKAKAAVLFEAITKSGGLDNVSPQQFANALTKFGKTTGIIFGDDAPRVQGIVRLLHATQQASVAAAAPPTGVQNSVPILAAILTDWMGTAGGAITSAGIAGAAARLYESAPVRNLLIGLGRTKPGSPQEGKALERLSKVLASQSGMAAANDNVAMGRAAASDEQGQQQQQ